jgi:ABC-type lipoprotein release transport system permease subunit
MAIITVVTLALALQGTTRTIAIDERLAADAGLRVGDRVVVTNVPGAAGDTVVIGAVTARTADPSEIARDEYRVRVHLEHLQQLIGYGDRVDRFAIATPGGDATARAVDAINDVAFGFRAHRSRDVAVETSQTFRVVSRFHRAIGVITIVASAIFLLCILLLKVDERRRDVAALRLLGISRRTVLGAVVLEAAFIAFVGSLAGTAIGALASAAVNAYYQAHYRTPLRFSIVTPDIVLLAAALSITLGIVAGTLAALRLVRARPLALLGR